ncbi:MAG: hypothetical protein R3E66_02835 [bacterium]
MRSALLAITFMVAGCSSDDSTGVGTDLGMDVGADVMVTDVTVDARQSDVDASGADQDVSEPELPPGPRLVDGETRVFEPGDVVACNCPNEDDVCTPRGECVLGTHGCFANEDCPDGYQCGDQICYANTDTTIVPLCQVNENCPSYTVCVGGACQTPRRCDLSMYCPPGLICGEGPAPVSTYCIGAGDKAGGETCTTGYECQSGNCLSGQCRYPCVRNTDCPGLGSCTVSGLCTVGDSPFDRAQCGDRVWSDDLVGQSCADRLCRNNADCSGDVCMMGFCVTADRSIGCKSNEFQEPLSPDHCFIYQRCENDAGCPPSYSCIRGGCGRLP